jgi:prepilin-type N-terminal cleavage/methylation domain-containing protein
MSALKQPGFCPHLCITQSATNQHPTACLRRAANLKGNTNMYQQIKASRQRQNEKGFTLIELLIVVVILGILAAVVIFASAGFKNKGAAESCKTTVSSVKTAVEAYHVDDPNALYPGVFTGATGIEPKYFDLNGITQSVAAGVTTVTGKGWSFTMTFGAVVAPATGSTSPPSAYTACLVP